MRVKSFSMSTTVGDFGLTRYRSGEKRWMTVELSRLAFEALTSGDPVTAAPERMEGALRCYLGDRSTDRPAWPYPGFLRNTERQADVEIELEVEEDLWQAFAEEAVQQEVTTEQLTEHAAFYFAAEMDAGRLTERILEDLGSADADTGQS
jgi:hypothetical protein